MNKSQTYNAIAAVIMIIAWVVGVIFDHMGVAWAMALATCAVMKIAGYNNAYSFDWVVRAFRRGPR